MELRRRRDNPATHAIPVARYVIIYTTTHEAANRILNGGFRQTADRIDTHFSGALSESRKHLYLLQKNQKTQRARQ